MAYGMKPVTTSSSNKYRAKQPRSNQALAPTQNHNPYSSPDAPTPQGNPAAGRQAPGAQGPAHSAAQAFPEHRSTATYETPAGPGPSADKYGGPPPGSFQDQNYTDQDQARSGRLMEGLETGMQDYQSAMDAMQGALGREQLGATRGLMGQLGASGFGASGAGASMAGDIQRQYDQQRAQQSFDLERTAQNDFTNRIAQFLGLSQSETKLMNEQEVMNMVMEQMEGELNPDPLQGGNPLEDGPPGVPDNLREQVKATMGHLGYSWAEAVRYLGLPSWMAGGGGGGDDDGDDGAFGSTDTTGQGQDPIMSAVLKLITG